MLHMHMLLWIAGNLNPEQMRVKFSMRILSGASRCLAGWKSVIQVIFCTHVEVSTHCEQSRANENYMDPMQMLSVPPPHMCKVHPENSVQVDCKQCNDFLWWDNSYQSTTDDLLLCSNVHSCSRGMKKRWHQKESYSLCFVYG